MRWFHTGFVLCALLRRTSFYLRNYLKAITSKLFKKRMETSTKKAMLCFLGRPWDYLPKLLSWHFRQFSSAIVTAQGFMLLHAATNSSSCCFGVLSWNMHGISWQIIFFPSSSPLFYTPFHFHEKKSDNGKWSYWSVCRGLHKNNQILFLKMVSSLVNGKRIWKEGRIHFFFTFLFIGKQRPLTIKMNNVNKPIAIENLGFKTGQRQLIAGGPP